MEYIRNLKEPEGTTIFMTTHYMDEAEYCERTGIIDKGQIVAMGTPEESRRWQGPRPDPGRRLTACYC
jgi:ABC-type multidrug transport system ATPase subunit